MDKCRVNIAVIEPSFIVYEGLSNLLLKSKKHYYLYRLNDLDEITYSTIKENFNIAIINPTVLQNKLSNFTKLKKNFPDISWVGLVYSFFDNDLLNKFDETFNITDPIDLITRKIDELFKNCTCVNNKQEQLSKREIDVLIQLIKGLSNKEVAGMLNISIHTVISHRKNITEKTGVKSLSGLTIYAISKKIIPLDTSSY